MGAGKQFLLLLWKNYLIQKRKVILTLFEIGVPTLFSLILVLIRQRIIVTNYDNPQYWSSFSVDRFDPVFVPPGGLPWDKSWGLAYAPKTPVTKSLAEKVAQRLGMYTYKPGQDLAFANESSMLEYLTSEKPAVSRVLGGLVFSGGVSEDGKSLTGKVQYKVRLRAGQFANVGRGRINILLTSDWYTELMFPLRPGIKPRNNGSARGGSPNYAREGFLQLQRATDLAVAVELGGGTVQVEAAAANVDVDLQRFPYPSFIDDRFILVIQQQFPFIILLSFIICAANIVKDVVLEKERKLKESMKMMGLANWLHWTAWLVKYLLFLLISVIIMTILICVRFGEGSILTYSDGSLLFVFLMLYCLSIITFCFAISTFFSKANSGAAAGCILYLVSYVPYFFLQSRYGSLSFGAKMAACLFNNVAMAFGCQQIGFYESTGAGMQWTNFFKPVNVDDDFSMAHVFLMMLIDIVLYSLIAWYFDAVMPGDYGIPKPFYFPFMRKYWCGTVTSKVEDNDVEMAGGEEPSPFFEKDPVDMTPGISIQKLKKVFARRGAEKVAVSDLTINMYEGQITALLGHNGAGKTTTMSMLTGFLPPTSGTAVVNGYDIRTDIESVRTSLGLCPQHDILFDELTVSEHLTFFAKLKGCAGARVKEEVREMIKLLKLESKTNVASSGLSGGMKRKLSVGIALIGGSKVVMLDEPTSGMDPEARRQTWDLLQSQRTGRTMVLTTHFMDEADLLGDRIAIMAEGVVQCAGSSLFLKNKYGVGYHMVMVKESGCDVAAITNLILKHVPGAALESNISAELSFVLPHESSSSFEALFAHLEANRKELRIASYGASVTTLEEVFLKVGEAIDDTLQQRLQKGLPEEQETPQGATNGGFTSMETDIARVAAEADVADQQGLSTFSSGRLIIEPDTWQPESKGGRNKVYNPQSSENGLNTVFGATYTKTSGLALYGQQFKSLFIKRMIHSWRNQLVTLTQLLVPLFFTTIGCIVLKTLPSGTDDPPPLSLSMGSFYDQTVLYQNDLNDTSFANAYQNVMAKTQSGVGQVLEVSDVGDKVLAIGEGSMEQYNRDFMVAAGFGAQQRVENVTNATSRATAFFNNQAYHTVAISLSMLGNGLLQYLTGNPSHTIETINHPLPRTTQAKLEQDMASQLAVAFIVAYNIMFGMAFLVGTFAVFLIKERAQKSKHIQYVSGVRSLTYWFSTFAWDFINYLIPATLLLFIFLAFQVDAYISENNLGYIFLIFVLYGWAVLPFVYLLSHLFIVPATGYVWITVLNIFTGTAAVLAILILNIPGLGTEDVAKVLEWVFYILLPNFAFGSSLQDFFINYESRRSCTKDDIPWEEFCYALNLTGATNGCCKDNCGSNCIVWQDNFLSFEKPGIGRACLFLALHGVLFMSAIFVMESGTASRLWQRVVEGTNDDHGEADTLEAQVVADSLQARVEEEEDVKAERERIVNTPISQLMTTDSLVLSEIKKYYGNFLAVDRLSVGVPQGECFGLLGVNGAGKTTTFKMMTGDYTVSSGDAFLDGFSIKRDIKKVQQRLGYCPQFDALIEQMTVEETLYMYARLRGVEERCIPDVVSRLIESLLLENYTKKQAGDLSGGNKRKLSTAIALVGDPPIIFLDEPTTGMDPVARRLLWDTLTKVRASGRTLVLTSHSMEECEALCTRMAIMVNGQFKCLGSTQHLKTKFGEGYTLMAKVGDVEQAEMTGRMRALMTFIEQRFPLHVLKDIHQGIVHYQILEPSLSWAELFGIMERAKEQYGIEDYSVSQTTLEQVFINFARTQRPPTLTNMGCGTKCCNCCKFFLCGGCCSNNGNRA